jgi:hypothetical protein
MLFRLCSGQSRHQSQASYCCWTALLLQNLGGVVDKESRKHLRKIVVPHAEVSKKRQERTKQRLNRINYCSALILCRVHATSPSVKSYSYEVKVNAVETYVNLKYV